MYKLHVFNALVLIRKFFQIHLFLNEINKLLYLRLKQNPAKQLNEK